MHINFVEFAYYKPGTWFGIPMGIALLIFYLIKAIRDSSSSPTKPDLSGGSVPHSAVSGTTDEEYREIAVLLAQIKHFESRKTNTEIREQLYLSPKEYVMLIHSDVYLNEQKRLRGKIGKDQA